MGAVMLAAAAYNILWGIGIIIWPNALFSLAGMAAPMYPWLWQCIGMFVLVWGIGYLVTAFDPLRYWPVVLVGLLGKVFGPIGFVYAAVSGQIPLAFGWTIITNDLIWWVPFAFILATVYHRQFLVTAESATTAERRDLLATYRTQCGERLSTLSNHGPVLLVFLRHFGCTFCREALTDISERRDDLRDRGVTPVLVHMLEPDDDAVVTELTKYALDDIPRIADPSKALYGAFGLNRGSFRQLFGWKALTRGFRAGVVDGHGVGMELGDGFQMPGVFVVVDGEIKASYRHDSAADRPDYLALVDKYQTTPLETIASSPC